MANEIVKYHNDFSNKIILKNFTASELNMLMAICSKMRDKETNEIILDFSVLKTLIKWDNNNNSLFVESLRNTNKKLLALNFEMPNEEAEYGGFTQFVLFPTFDVLPKSKQLKVSVNKKFSYLLNGLSSNFTRFELENFTTLQSKYSKILYKELMKFKSTGYKIFEIDDFKEKLDIPKKYEMRDINKRVLSKTTEELSKIFSKFEVNKIKKGRDITHIEFTFKLKKQEKEDLRLFNVPNDSENSDISYNEDDYIQASLFEETAKEKPIIAITNEEYERRYTEYLGSQKDSATQRKIFKMAMEKEGYRIEEKSELKRVFTEKDIPTEKLLSKSGKKLVGSALKMRIDKILKEMNG